MSETQQRPADELLRCFFSECERRFRFLQDRHGYHFICGLGEYRNNYRIIRPPDGRRIDESFLAVARYEQHERAIEMTYAHERFAIEAHAFYNCYERFGLDEMLSAARKNAEELRGDWGAASPALVQKTLRRIAADLETYAHIILEPKPRLLARAVTIRNSRVEHAVRQKHRDLVAKACKDAAAAYRKKDYRNVVALLGPHEKHLQKADLKKLSRAKKYLLSL